MTAQDHARDCAKRILIYLNLEATERRVAKIQGLVADHMERYKPGSIKLSTKTVYEKVYKTVYVPLVDMSYIPKDTQNIYLLMMDAAKFVCEKHGISIDQLRRDSPIDAYMIDHAGLRRRFQRRCNFLVNARQEFVRTVKRNHFNEISYRVIGDFLGYKNHTSITHLWKDRK